MFAPHLLSPMVRTKRCGFSESPITRVNILFLLCLFIVHTFHNTSASRVAHVHRNSNDHGGNPLVPSTMDVDTRANEIALALDQNARNSGRDQSLARQVLSSVPQMSSYINSDNSPKFPREIYNKKVTKPGHGNSLGNSFSSENK